MSCVKNSTLFHSLIANSKDRVQAAVILDRYGCRLTACECAHVGLEIALKAIMARFDLAIIRTHSLPQLVKAVLAAFKNGQISGVYWFPLIRKLERLFGKLYEPLWMADYRYTKSEFSSRDYDMIMALRVIADSLLKELEQS